MFPIIHILLSLWLYLLSSAAYKYFSWYACFGQKIYELLQFAYFKKYIILKVLLRDLGFFL